jgi:HlyD family secretion protein
MTVAARKPIIPLFLAIVAVTGLAWAGWRDGGWFRGAQVAVVAGTKAERARLDVTVVQRGNLAARNAARIYSELEGRSAILDLVEEGTLVKEGTVLVRLDSSALEDRKVAQDIAVQNARAALTKAEQNLQIQLSQNTSDIAVAAQNLDFARSDLRKYVEGDWPMKLQESEETIVLADTELAQAKDRWEWSDKLEKSGFLTRSELETDALSLERVRIKLEQAKRSKALLEKFDHPKEQRRIEAAVEEATRELDRVNLQTSARLVDLTADVSTNRAKSDLEQEKFLKLQDQIAKATIRSPAEGYVVYKRSEGGMGRSGEMIQKGTEIQERQEILSIPQAGGMIAEVSIHESVVQKVRQGMRARIMVDAIPGREFTGEVTSVALVPDSNSWWANPNLRQFKTSVSVLDASAEMKPGMSCNVEILVDSVEAALLVPVQAVYRTGGKTVCFVAGSQLEIGVGRSSEAWVEVTSGLEEGAIVALAPPIGFKPEPEPAPEMPSQPQTPATGPPVSHGQGGAQPPRTGGTHGGGK